MILFILLGLLSGLAVSVLVAVIDSKKPALAVIVLLPLLAITIYLQQGHPDMPDAFAKRNTGTIAKIEVMRLAEKPVERLEQTGGRDAGALAVMGDLNARLGNNAGAVDFYTRALAQAERDDDPRADIYRARINHLNEK